MASYVREPSYLSFVEASVILRKICKFFPEEMEPHPPFWDSL